MSSTLSSNERISSKIEIAYPDYAKLPKQVQQKYESLPTKVNFFRMLGYSPGAYVESHRSNQRHFQEAYTIRLPQRASCSAGGCT